MDQKLIRSPSDVSPSLESMDTGNMSKSNYKDDLTSPVVIINSPVVSTEAPEQTYRLYRKRFVGLVGLMLLNAVGGLCWPWFGPIASETADDLGFTLNEVNWLSNIVNVTYLPFSILVPFACNRYGIRRTCEIGCLSLLIGAWVRFAGTTGSLPRSEKYALIIIGQFFGGVAQPFFQVLGPRYSETWFDLQGRTTATMILSIANPVGGAIAQLISPITSTVQQSILVLGIITTAAVPLVLLIGDAPPTPPTYAASQKSPSFASLVRAMSGREPCDAVSYMSWRERIDFAIIVCEFGVLVGVVNSFSILTGQDFGPYGYSATVAGLMGATILLTGIVAAAVTAPLFDRVLTHHLALTCKVLCPILGASWLSLIWATRPHNAGPLFAIMAIIGACSLTLLPAATELAVEVTRNPDGSNACLWFAGNLFAVIFVLAEGALRAGPDGNPPLNMHKALILQGAITVGAIGLVFGLKGRQARRETDEQQLAQARAAVALGEREPS